MDPYAFGVEADQSDAAALARYLEASFQELDARMSSGEQFSVGDSIQVTFTKDFANAHNIGLHGRVGQEKGVRQIYAGPSTTDTTLAYPMTYEGHMDEFEKWSLKEQVAFNFPDRYDPPPPIRTKVNSPIHKVEQTVLELAFTLVPKIHMMFPSDGALWRAEHNDISVTVQRDRREKVFELLKQMNKKVDSFPEEIDPGVLTYLGSNGPWSDRLPKHWFALAPNPYQLTFPYEPCEILKVKDGTAITYVRNNIDQQYVLLNEPDYFVIPPQTVDRKFTMEGEAFFVMTNYLPLATMFEVEFAADAPVLGYFPHDLPTYDHEGISQNEAYVFDRIGVGTYASRRQSLRRYAASIGKMLIPVMSRVGNYQVTLYDPVPRSRSEVVVREGIRSYIGSFLTGVVPRKQEKTPLEHHGNYVLYGPLLQTGTPFKSLVGRFIQVPFVRREHSGSIVEIPPICKRPLYLFRDVRHLSMSQFEILDTLFDRGLRANFRYGEIGRTQKLPSSALKEMMMDILQSAPEVDSALNTGVSDREMAERLGVSIGQVESMLTGSLGVLYLGQWKRNSKLCGYWTLRLRYTKRKSGVLVTEVLRDWELYKEVQVDIKHMEFFEWFFYNQGQPVVSAVRKKGHDSVCVLYARSQKLGASKYPVYAEPWAITGLEMMTATDEVVRRHSDPPRYVKA